MLKIVFIASLRIAPSVGRAVGLSLIALVALAASGPGQARAQYRELVARIPGDSNTAVIFNVQKIVNSPLGVKQGWAKNLDKAFQNGVSRVPPQAEGLVLASQMDFQFVKPIWEAAVVHVGQPLPLDEIAKRRAGTVDTLDGKNAVELPNDTYVVQWEPDTLVAMGPANRQMVVKWLREMKTGGVISPYLQKAAGYVDDAGTEIILAADLDGAFAPEAIRAYVNTKKEMLGLAQVDLGQAAKFLASIYGVRIGVRIGDKPFGRLAVDCDQDVTIPADTVNALLTEVIADAGLKIGDMAEWKAEVKGKEFSVSGYLTESALRRIFSLIDSPAPAYPAEEKDEKPASQDSSPSDPKGKMATATLRYYESITEMFDDVKQDWKDLKSLSAGSIFFDRYARKIENLPILNVDPVMVDYGAYMANQFRGAAGSVRTMGIRGSYRQTQVGSAATASGSGVYSAAYDPYYGDYYSGYRAGWSPYGAAYNAAANTNAFYDATRAVGAQKRAIRAEERGLMATDVATARNNAIDATNKIRRMMTEKYQIEF
jgi:hypothetical protein